MKKEIRVRFAPSPTGPLHIGGARSALFNYLFAKHFNGTLILRMEDTDQERSSREAEENIKQSLKWLGIEWDEGIDVGGDFGPYRQMERLNLYRKYVERLLEKGKAYKCYCSEEDLKAERERMKQRNEMPRYTGRCRDLTEEQCLALEREGKRPVIRFRVPEGRILTVNDLVRGKVQFETDGIGDFIILRSDGIPTYNFAVVVDDALMQITHIIRGEEHLSNTPRQLLLFEALGLKVPEVAHISLILGKDRSKMSKRHGSTSVAEYRKRGYLPEALVNFLALLGWAPEGEEEIFSLEELIQNFSLNRVSKSPAVFDLEKLKWINGYYIRKSPIERLVALAVPHLQQAGLIGEELSAAERDYLTKVVEIVRSNLSCMEEINLYARQFFIDSIEFEDEKAKGLLMQERVPEVLELFQRKVEGADEINSREAKSILKEISKELNLGGKKVFMPLRVALTGQKHGPELHELISVLGPARAVQRVRNAMKQVRKG